MQGLVRVQFWLVLAAVGRFNRFESHIAVAVDGEEGEGRGDAGGEEPKEGAKGW